MPVDVNTPLGDLVIADSRRSRVLEKYDLDYCCHGHVSLADAAAAKGVDLAELTGALEIPAEARREQPADRDNSALAHDIVDTHHAYMWQEMPRLQALVEKVQSVHGGRHPELAEVQATFTTAVAALDPHMTSEERVIFPAISRMEKTQALTPIGSLAEPIQQLRDEHEVVGQLFRKIRALTGNYAAPEDGCNSYRMMLQGLEQMHLDLHEHIHKENNILFPRVLELEENVVSG